MADDESAMRRRGDVAGVVIMLALYVAVLWAAFGGLL
jgi:cbb3-type cytochrome oxidase subunit 3